MTRHPVVEDDLAGDTHPISQPVLVEGAVAHDVANLELHGPG